MAEDAVTASAFERLQGLIQDGPDLEDLDQFDDVLTRVAAFIKSGDLLENIGSFCSENCAAFADSDGEYKLEWTPMHEQYSMIIESQLESFLQSQGIELIQFYEICKECQARSKEEGRWNRDAMFVQLLTASTEFEGFVTLMRDFAAES